MRCPFCGADGTTVVETRESEEGHIVRRRRRCGQCEKRFTTHENAEIQFPYIVKRNGSRIDFSHDKLVASMQLALRKRPVTAEAIDSAVSRIEERLLALGEREVSSQQVGELVMRELKKLDKVAYVRFASVYRNFTDIDEFSEVIREISPTV